VNNIPNPLKGAPLKDWPDYPLVLGGVLLTVFVLTWLKGVPYTDELATVTLGVWFFALGGKIAHYRKRDKDVEGNANAWFPAWRHSVLADILAVIGLILMALGVGKLAGLI